MTAYKRADMIDAKNHNHDIVLFGIKFEFGKTDGFVEVELSDLVEDKCYEYFACIHKHKEAVLTSLNRSEGIPQVKCNNRWIGVLIGFGDDWDPRDWYMNYERESRVSREDPKTEKRWIAVFKILKDGEYHNSSSSYKTIKELKENQKYWAPHGFDDFYDWQFIEIEVEI